MKKILIGFLVIFFSCSKSKVPKGILKPEKMQSVFWDYIRADAFANEFIRRDSSKNLELESARLQQQVFDLHKVSKKEFYDSYDYYLKHQGLMQGMMDTMIARQQRINEKKLNEQTLKEQKVDTLRKIKKIRKL